jgi:hypothetical protein
MKSAWRESRSKSAGDAIPVILTAADKECIATDEDRWTQGVMFEPGNNFKFGREDGKARKREEEIH